MIMVSNIPGVSGIIMNPNDMITKKAAAMIARAVPIATTASFPS